MKDRQALAAAVNTLTDSLDPDEEVTDEELEEARERLSLMLDRGRLADRVEHFDAGVRIKVKTSRGDSPRDQDEWTLEGKGETYEEAAREFDKALDEYQERWADDVRGTDPYEE